MLPVPFAMTIKHLNSPFSAAIDPALFLIRRHRRQQQSQMPFPQPRYPNLVFLRYWHTPSACRCYRAMGPRDKLCVVKTLNARNPRGRGACTTPHALSAVPLSLLSHPKITSSDSWAQHGLTCDIGGVIKGSSVKICYPCLCQNQERIKCKSVS